jgi:hypothetical protein
MGDLQMTSFHLSIPCKIERSKNKTHILEAQRRIIRGIPFGNDYLKDIETMIKDGNISDFVFFMVSLELKHNKFGSVDQIDEYKKLVGNLLPRYEAISSHPNVVVAFLETLPPTF